MHGQHQLEGRGEAMGLPVGDLEQTDPTMKSGYDIMLRIRCHSSKKKT